jgi:hypothetical protein
MTAVFRFNPSELYQELPGPGYYVAIIMAAQCCHSSRGNPMLKVSYQLDEVADSYARVADYFVLEGVSPQGAAMARRRLAELCRAAGLDPLAGQLVVSELVGIELQVKVDLDSYADQPRLRVVGYRELGFAQVDISG